MKTKRLSFALLGLLGVSGQAGAFELTGSLTGELEPIITIDRDDSGVTVDYTFPGAFQQEDDLYPGTVNLAIPGFGSNMEPGEASWLVRWDTFEIPYGCDASVQTLLSETTVLPVRLAPARPDLINSSEEVYSFENVPPVGQYPGWFPQNPVEKGAVKIYRDRNILYVGVYPVSYNMQEGMVKAVDRLTYRVTFSPGIMTLSTEPGSSSRHDVEDGFMSAVFTSVSEDTQNSSEEFLSEVIDPAVETQAISPNVVWNTGESYLILSRSIYATAVNKFASWKKSMGYNVKVVMSDTWSPATIKSTVQSNYNSDSNLKYLLLFGDEMDLPGEKHTPYIYPFYTDYFYACMDGADDDVPDLFHGRLSVTSSEEANTIVDKIMNYEKLSTGYKGKAVICAEFSDRKDSITDGYEDRRFTRTCEDIANGLVSEGKTITRVYYHNKIPDSQLTPTNWGTDKFGYGEPIPDFLKHPSFNWKGDNTDIINAINSGAGYVLHRDHGLIQQWSKPNFTVTEAKKLNNGKDTPIVFSINCLTGMYHYYPIPGRYDAPLDLQYSIDSFNGRSTCLAEALLRKKNGGAVAVYGATQLSYTQNNDVFVMEMFQLIWPTSQFCAQFPGYTPTQHNSAATPIRKLGEILNASKLRLSQKFSGIMTTHNNQIYHLFGDPSMEIREAIPVSPNVRITILSEASSVLRQYKVDIPSSYRLVRVPNNGNEKVVWTEQFPYLLTGSDLDNYSYYITGNNIAPTPLTNFMSSTQSEEAMRIDEISDNGGMLKVGYTIPEGCGTVTLSIRRISDGSMMTVECNPNEDAVYIDMQGQSKGIYLIELNNNGTIIDTQKIMLK